MLRVSSYWYYCFLNITILSEEISVNMFSNSSSLDNRQIQGFYAAIVNGEAVLTSPCSWALLGKEAGFGAQEGQTESL